MRRTRVIPVLLLMDRGLYKTKRFKNPTYIGDPINAIKIFNDKGVDELVLLDINATKHNAALDLDFLGSLAEECFVPLCYGGGVKNEKDAEAILKIGFEKISVNSAALNDEKLIWKMAESFGSQSVVGSIDVKRNIFGKPFVFNSALDKRNFFLDPVTWAKKLVELGVGELLINSVDNDGFGCGYDLKVIKEISGDVNVPVIACGGANNVSHFLDAINAGAAAVAGGQMFVFQGKHRAVLISYPDESELKRVLP